MAHIINTSQVSRNMRRQRYGDNGNNAYGQSRHRGANRGDLGTGYVINTLARGETRSRHQPRSDNDEPDEEDLFKASFTKFYRTYIVLMAFIIYISLVLFFTTQLFPYDFYIATISVQILVGVRALSLIRDLLNSKIKTKQAGLIYAIIELIIYILFLLSIRDSVNPYKGEFHLLFIVTGVLSLCSFLIKIASSYFNNWRNVRSLLSVHINKAIGLTRLLLLLQGCVLLVQFCVDCIIPWFAVFAPSWLIVLQLSFLVGKYIQILTSRLGHTQICSPMNSTKILGIVWIFFNLLSLIGLISWGLIYTAYLLDYSVIHKRDAPIMALYIAMFVYSLCCLVYTALNKNDIYTVMMSIAKYMDLPPEKREKKIQRQLKLQTAAIKYVVKLSDSYYRSAKPEEMPIEGCFNTLKSCFTCKKRIKKEENEAAPKTDIEQKDIENNKVVTVEDQEIKGSGEIGDIPNAPGVEKEVIKGSTDNNDEKKSETNSEFSDKISVDIEQDSDKSEDKPKLPWQNKESGKCVICFDANANAVLMPCGHSDVCYKCVKEIMQMKQECHICRVHVECVLKIRLHSKKNNLYKVINQIDIGKFEKNNILAREGIVP